MIRTYTDTVNSFASNNCQLLTTEEEFKLIHDISKNTTVVKYRYVASCGHEHIVYYHVFLGRKTGVICPKCIRVINASKIKGQMKERGKLQYLQMEYDCSKYFMNLIQDNFTVIKAFDGCKADIIIKPVNMVEDRWLGIQVKTTHKPTRGYGFLFPNDYPDCLILCICLEDKKMWAIPNEHIANIGKISIGLNKSKYDKYEITPHNIVNVLTELYNTMQLHNFEKHDTPQCIYQQREKEFYRFRESKIDFIKFDYNYMEGMVYDFKIGDKKIQEKVAGGVKNKNIYKVTFTLCKNNGRKDHHYNQIQYNKGDNDFYWLNCDNKKHFFVIPEQILINRGYIEGETIKKILKITPSNLPQWLVNYSFDYDDIDKARLTTLLNVQ